VAVPSYVIFITLHVSLVVGIHAGALGFTGLCVQYAFVVWPKRVNMGYLTMFCSSLMNLLHTFFSGRHSNLPF